MNVLRQFKGVEEHIGDIGNLARTVPDRPLLWRAGEKVQGISLSAFQPQKSLHPEEVGAS